jgi:malyl-CoA/(S)-citramalyl-CoA lyase
VQIDIARKVFSPPVDEVKWALRVIEAMGDGTGAVRTMARCKTTRP